MGIVERMFRRGHHTVRFHFTFAQVLACKEDRFDGSLLLMLLYNQLGFEQRQYLMKVVCVQAPIFWLRLHRIC